MSKACLPPIQPHISKADREHPRIAEYIRYRSAMSSQLVEADNFKSWLAVTEDNERPKEVVFRTRPGAEMVDGWYKHKFAPGHRLIARVGPFATKAEAETA